MKDSFSARWLIGLAAVLLVTGASALLGAVAERTSVAHLDGGVTSSSRSGQGYPPPATATAHPSPTPIPDADGRFPPPIIPHRILSMQSSPFARVLVPLERSFRAGDALTIASWVFDSAGGAALDRLGDSEGYGTRLSTNEMRRVIEEALIAGSQPVVQGYFASPGCAPAGPEPCAVWVVSTGWQGPIAMPDKPQNEDLGPIPPSTLPLGAAVWELAPDVTGVFFAGWWLFDGYYEALDQLHDEGWGEYTVIR